MTPEIPLSVGKGGRQSFVKLSCLYTVHLSFIIEIMERSGRTLYTEIETIVWHEQSYLGDFIRLNGWISVMRFGPMRGMGEFPRLRDIIVSCRSSFLFSKSLLELTEYKWLICSVKWRGSRLTHLLTSLWFFYRGLNLVFTPFHKKEIV